MNRKRVNLAFLVLFSAYLFLLGLGNMALTDPDEVFYAQTAKEMLDKGDWVTPHIFGQPQFEKPVFYYWLVMVSYKIFGVNEFAARFPSAVFGILGILGIYYLGRNIFSSRAGLYASLIMATSIEYIILARACVTDMVLCVFILWGFMFYFEGYLNQDSRKYYLWSAVMFAGAVLTKGPVGLVLPLGVLLLFLIYKKDLKAILRYPIVPGVIIFLAVVAPWYLLMYKKHGMVFIDHFFGFQNITRFLHPEHKSGDVVYYYLPILLGGFLPWSIFLPQGISRVVRNDSKRKQWHVFLAIWIVVFFLFFTFSRTKLPTYIFPLFPALAIFMGRSIELNFRREKWEIADMISAVLYILVYPVSSAIFYMLAVKKYPLLAPGVLKTATFIIFCVLITGYCLYRMWKKLFFGALIVTIGFFIIPLNLFLAKPIGMYESSKYIAKELKAKIKPGEQVGSETDYRRGIAFYLDKTDVPDIHAHHDLTKFLDSEDRVWAVLKDKNHKFLYTDKKAPYSRPTYMVYKLGKKGIVTNILPDDGKYLKLRSINDPL